MPFFDRPVIWHVIFHPKFANQWWTRRFGHVSLAGFANETWVHLDLARAGVVVNPIFHYEDVEDFLTTILHYHTVVRFGTSRGEYSHFLHPMSCVSFVKHTLGVRSRALLPDRLFTTLIRDYGAEIVNDAQGPQGNTGTEAAAPTG